MANTIKFGPGDTKGSDVPNSPTQGEAQPSMPSGTGVPDATITNPAFKQLGMDPAAAIRAIDQPTGQQRFLNLISQGASAGTPNSQGFDKWLLSQQNDPSDPQFNLMLVGAKAKASEREQLRSAWGGDLDAATEAAIERGEKPQPLAPNEKAALGTANALKADALKTESGSSEVKGIKKATANYKSPPGTANKRAANEDLTRGKAPVGGETPGMIVGIDGQPVQPAGQAPPPATQSKDLAGNPKAQTAQDIGKQVQQGGYVYIGTAPNTVTGPAAVGRTNVQTDRYMKTEDAKDALVDPDQVRFFQHMMGLPETGLPDDKTYAAWSKVVDTAERLTRNGIKMDPMTVAVALVKKGGGGSGGGGGGGGGGGSAKFKMSDVQSLLTGVMQNEVGRDPTQAEVSQFYSYFNGLAGGDTANPSQIATDWVRTHLGKQVGSYGAATTYYQAMLAVLGASAAGGAG